MTSVRRRLVVSLIVLVALVGCGHDVYERRFDETKRYFAYLERLNEFLSRTAWLGKSVKLRIPKQFQGITAPVAKEGEETDKQHDPRQPEFLKLVLPGLQGAWKADLALVGGEGRAQAYMYVLSNFDMLGNEQKKEDNPADFIDDVLKKIAAAVEQEAPSYAALTTLEVPKGEAYVDRLTYKVSSDFALNIDGKDYHIRVYCYKKERSPAETVIVYIVPDNVSPSEKLDKAIELSLETLEITQEKPVSLPGQGAPGTPPTGSRGL